MRIILASGSRQRKLLMDALDIEYEIIPADVDEKSIRDTDLKTRAEKIARLKGETVAQKEQGIIIAADTFIEIDGEVMEKPVDIGEARAMLEKFSGKTAFDYTGFLYLDKENEVNFSTCVVNELTFRKLSPEEIKEYVTKFPVTTWSGGVSPAYPYGLTLFESITGSPTAFSHGLPMNLLIPLLEKSGIKIQPK